MRRLRDTLSAPLETMSVRMSRTGRHWALGASGLLVCWVVGSGLAAADEPSRPRSVVKLSARRSASPTTVLVEQAFRDRLERDFGSPVDLHIEYLDLPSAMTPAFERRQAALLAEKYANRATRWSWPRSPGRSATCCETVRCCSRVCPSCSPRSCESTSKRSGRRPT